MEKTIDQELKRGELIEMIRKMKVGDTLRFPLTKLESVRNVAYNRLVVEKSEGCQWKVVADIPGKQTIIERIA